MLLLVSGGLVKVFMDREALLEVYQSEDRHQSSDLFICEGRWVVESLLKSGAWEVHSVIVVEGQHDDFVPNVPADIQVLRVSQEEADALLGFHFHRGVLAAAKKPGVRSLVDWIEEEPGRLTDTRPWVIAPQIADPSNIGAIIRNAAALGAGAVITSTSGASPWYRKAIRTSAGAVFRVPIVTSPSLALDIDWLGKRAEAEIVALALTTDAVTIGNYRPKEGAKPALVLGPEGHGLSSRWLKRCQVAVEIPMAEGIDSLNVATSAAVMLYHLHQGQAGKS